MQNFDNVSFDFKEFYHTNIYKYGDPRISWFQNSWYPLFHYLVLGTNFVKSPLFHDFQKKIQKNFKTIFQKKIFSFFSENYDELQLLPPNKY